MAAAAAAAAAVVATVPARQWLGGAGAPGSSRWSRPARRRLARMTSARAEGGGGKRYAVVTGGNTGMGKETVLALARQGIDTVLATRDLGKGERAREDVLQLLGSNRGLADIAVAQLDLTSLDSVRGFAREVTKSGRPVDILVNNAGIMACPKLVTKDGFEMQLGVNHLGHFLLTSLLMESITKSSSARIVNVSSAAHVFGKFDFNDLALDKKYEPWPAYGRSKLANVLFTYELVRRLPKDANITVNCLHPGLVKTELGRYLLPEGASIFQKLSVGAFFLFTKTPQKGAETAVYLATLPEAAGITGKYFVNSKEKKSSPLSYDKALAARLWDVSEQMTGAKWALKAPTLV